MVKPRPVNHRFPHDWRRRLIRKTLWPVLLGGLAASCARHETPSLESSNPDALIPAIKSSVAAGDRRAIPYLVGDLDNEDSAVRMYAIDGLVRLTGQDLGYEYYLDAAHRGPAVERWKQWLSLQPELRESDSESSNGRSGGER
jgi:hypothetical protein